MALQLDQVTVDYGTVNALTDITGSVAPGQSVALIGPNGSGKSTLLKAILGLVPLRSGRIEVLGHDPADARAAGRLRARSRSRSTPSSRCRCTRSCSWAATASVGWVRRPGRADRAAAHAALDRVGLDDRVGRPVRHALGRASASGC